YHLPFLSGARRGVFARHGLDVEVLDAPPPPWTANAVRVARGEVDFAASSVACFLLARTAAHGEFPARFVAVLHQRSPLAAVVPADSAMATVEDLAGQRIGRGRWAEWMAEEARQAVADHGVRAPEVVPVEWGEVSAALARREIDVIAVYLDAAAGMARRPSASGVRTVELGGDTYATGILANDRVPHDVIVRMRHALTDAFEAQRDDPEAGVELLCDQIPHVRADQVRAVWARLVPFVFGNRPVGTMGHRRWADTMAWARRVHGIGQLDAADVYRTELEGAGGWLGR
ncbi:MAG TPA: ABC transporter substrate-binding protein, partial [Acidimicrobiales bacterium]|nr:ABC transporter substrate-binding protein [Acidimicrobiales bacterium]